MRLLLDTHAFIWADGEPQRLSPRAAAAIRSAANEVFVSVVSVWEIVIKAGTGQLKTRLPIADIVRDQTGNGMRLLPVELAHVLAVQGLPLVHRDPFDRLLIAQAIVEGAYLVTADTTIPDYPVPVLW